MAVATLTDLQGEIPTLEVEIDGKIATIFNYGVSESDLGLSVNESESTFSAVCMDPAGNRVLSADNSGTVVMYNITDGTYKKIGTTSSPIMKAIFSNRDENLVYLAHADCSISCINVETGDVVASLKGHQEPIVALTQTANGELLFSCSSDLATVWATETWTSLQYLRGTDSIVVDFAVAHNAFFIAMAFSDDSVVVYDYKTFAPIARLTLMEGESGASLRHVAIADDGSLIAASADNGCTYIWELSHQTPIRIVDAPHPATSIKQLSILSSTITAIHREIASSSGTSVPLTASPQLVLLDNVGRLFMVEIGPQEGICHAVLVLEAKQNGSFNHFALNSDATLLALTTTDGRAELYDVPIAKVYLLDGVSGSSSDRSSRSRARSMPGGSVSGSSRSVGTSSPETADYTPDSRHKSPLSRSPTARLGGSDHPIYDELSAQEFEQDVSESETEPASASGLPTEEEESLRLVDEPLILPKSPARAAISHSPSRAPQNATQDDESPMTEIGAEEAEELHEEDLLSQSAKIRAVEEAAEATRLLVERLREERDAIEAEEAQLELDISRQSHRSRKAAMDSTGIETSATRFSPMHKEEKMYRADYLEEDEVIRRGGTEEHQEEEEEVLVPEQESELPGFNHEEEERDHLSSEPSLGSSAEVFPSLSNLSSSSFGKEHEGVHSSVSTRATPTDVAATTRTALESKSYEDAALDRSATKTQPIPKEVQMSADQSETSRSRPGPGPDIYRSTYSTSFGSTFSKGGDRAGEEEEEEIDERQATNLPKQEQRLYTREQYFSDLQRPGAFPSITHPAGVPKRRAGRPSAGSSTASNALPSRGTRPAEEALESKQSEVDTHVPHAAIPTFQLLKTLGLSDSPEAAHRKLLRLLSQTGSFPAKFRASVWKFLARAPSNGVAYAHLCARAPISSQEHHIGVDRRALARLQRVQGALRAWNPALLSCTFARPVVTAFVDFFGNDELAAFEVSMTVLLALAPAFAPSDASADTTIVRKRTVAPSSAPFEISTKESEQEASNDEVEIEVVPVTLLAQADALLRARDPALAKHLDSLGITAADSLWPLMSQFLCKCLGPNDWCVATDFLLAHVRCLPLALLCCAVDVLRRFRAQLLAVQAPQTLLPRTRAFGAPAAEALTRARSAQTGNFPFLQPGAGVHHSSSVLYDADTRTHIYLASQPVVPSGLGPSMISRGRGLFPLKDTHSVSRAASLATLSPLEDELRLGMPGGVIAGATGVVAVPLAQQTLAGIAARAHAIPGSSVARAAARMLHSLAGAVLPPSELPVLARLSPSQREQRLETELGKGPVLAPAPAPGVHPVWTAPVAVQRAEAGTEAARARAQRRQEALQRLREDTEQLEAERARFEAETQLLGYAKARAQRARALEQSLEAEKRTKINEEATEARLAAARASVAIARSSLHQQQQQQLVVHQWEHADFKNEDANADADAVDELLALASAAASRTSKLVAESAVSPSVPTTTQTPPYSSPSLPPTTTTTTNTALTGKQGLSSSNNSNNVSQTEILNTSPFQHLETQRELNRAREMRERIQAATAISNRVSSIVNSVNTNHQLSSQEALKPKGSLRAAAPPTPSIADLSGVSRQQLPPQSNSNTSIPPNNINSSNRSRFSNDFISGPNSSSSSHSNNSTSSSDHNDTSAQGSDVNRTIRGKLRSPHKASTNVTANSAANFPIQNHTKGSESKEAVPMEQPSAGHDALPERPRARSSSLSSISRHGHSNGTSPSVLSDRDGEALSGDSAEKHRPNVLYEAYRSGSSSSKSSSRSSGSGGATRLAFGETRGADSVLQTPAKNKSDTHGRTAFGEPLVPAPEDLSRSIRSPGTPLAEFPIEQ